MSDIADDRDEDQTMALPCGRFLGFARYGVATSSLPTTFYLHGYPSCRLEARLMAKDLFTQGLQVISVDRPGFGLSSPQPGRTLSDYAKDVQALAAYLKLKQFAILGYSGGAPYALACARLLPQSSLIAVGIAAGLGPYKHVRSLEVWKDLWWINKLGVIGPIYFPRIYAVFYRQFVKLLLWGSKHKSYEEITQSSLFNKIPMDQQKLLLKVGKEGYEGTMDALCGSMAQGSWTQHHMTEAQLFAGDLTFSLSDIEPGLVELWYGDKDINAPLSLGRCMAREIPGAELHVVEGATHSHVILDGVKMIKKLLHI